LSLRSIICWAFRQRDWRRLSLLTALADANRAASKSHPTRVSRRERGRLARKIGEDFLSDIFRKVRVPSYTALRHGIYRPDMPANQLGERLVRSLVGVEAKQFGVIAHGFALSSTGSLVKPHKKTPETASLAVFRRIKSSRN
jgi:hypothetical protein